MQSFAAFFGYPPISKDSLAAKEHAVLHDRAADYRRYVLVNGPEEAQRKREEYRAAHQPHTIPSSSVPKNDIEEIANVGNRLHENIKVNLTSGNKIVITLGCQGEGNLKQDEVAALLDKVVAHYKQLGYEIACVLVLGDNIYNNGAETPIDPKFNKCCYNVYTSDRTPHLKDVKFFYIQGNHDQNRHRWKEFSTNETGIDLGLNQVAATFVPRDARSEEEMHQCFFSEENKLAEGVYLLDKSKLKHFNMPSRAYSLIIDDMEIFCVDSNTLVQDCKNLEKKLVEKNQVSWLKESHAKSRASGFKQVLALHHAPATVGKREFGNDVHLYTDEKKGCYNHRINDCLKQLNTDFDAIFAAHDHGLYYYFDQEKKLSLVISAGGGGELQPRLDVKTNKNVPAFCEAHGVVSLKSSKENHTLDFGFYTDHPYTMGLPLLFNNKTEKPVRVWKTEDVETLLLQIKPGFKSADIQTFHLCQSEEEYQRVVRLYEAVKAGVDKFMERMSHMKLNKKNRPDLDQKQMKIAHDLLTYINGPVVRSYDVSLINIFKIAKLDIDSTLSGDKMNLHLINAYSDYHHEQSIFKDFDAALMKHNTSEAQKLRR